MQITPFALGSVGLSPYDFWFPANSATPSTAKANVFCLDPGFAVLICSHNLAQLHSNLALQLFKNIFFFIIADPNQILMGSSQE